MPLASYTLVPWSRRAYPHVARPRPSYLVCALLHNPPTPVPFTSAPLTPASPSQPRLLSPPVPSLPTLMPSPPMRSVFMMNMQIKKRRQGGKKWSGARRGCQARVFSCGDFVWRFIHSHSALLQELIACPLEAVLDAARTALLSCACGTQLLAALFRAPPWAFFIIRHCGALSSVSW